MNIQDFVIQHLADDVNKLALQRNRYLELTDADFSFAIRQIEGSQRTKDKLSFLQDFPNWHFPKRLSTEQCSSQITAEFKASLMTGNTLTDLTGGMGIDMWFMSEKFKEAHYVEHNEELCELAHHNFSTHRSNIEVHCSDADKYLQDMIWSDVVYIDPARRNNAGKKVFRLEDCEPNVISLLPALHTRCSTLLLKLSPMLDLSAAIKDLGCVDEVHIVSVNNEVKEVLIICSFEQKGKERVPESSVKLTDEHGEHSILFHAVSLNKNQAFSDFVFTADEERRASCLYADRIHQYIFEPNAAIMKAGAFKTIACRYGLLKLAPNSHLYTADVIPDDFQGRVWQVIDTADKQSIKKERLNIISRNHPLSADQLRKKYSIREGSTQWLIATSIHSQPIFLLAERIKQ